MCSSCNNSNDCQLQEITEEMAANDRKHVKYIQKHIKKKLTLLNPYFH